MNRQRCVVRSAKFPSIADNCPNTNSTSGIKNDNAKQGCFELSWMDMFQCVFDNMDNTTKYMWEWLDNPALKENLIGSFHLCLEGIILETA